MGAHKWLARRALLQLFVVRNHLRLPCVAPAAFELDRIWKSVPVFAVERIQWAVKVEMIVGGGYIPSRVVAENHWHSGGHDHQSASGRLSAFWATNLCELHAQSPTLFLVRLEHLIHGKLRIARSA